MTDITPLSNPEDILRDAQQNTPPVYVPVAAVPVAAPPVITMNQAATVDINHAPEAVDYVAPVYVRPIEQTPFINPPTAVPIAGGQDYSQKPFSYRLPVVSYVLVWFYCLTAVIFGFALISTIVSYAAVSGHTSVYGGASYAEYATKAFQASLVLFGGGLLLVSGMVYALLSGKKIFRYIALGVSILALGYELYKIGPLLGTESGALLGAFMGVYVILFAPYVLLPLVTTIYLLTPKAARAYK